MDWSNFGSDIGFGFGSIFMVVSWILVITGIVYFMKIAAAGTKRGGYKEPASDILKRRYTRGEISKEECARMKRDLWRS
jgi:putative membrane protein